MTADRIELLLDRFADLEVAASWGIIQEFDVIAEQSPEELAPYTDRLLEEYIRASGGFEHELGKIVRQLAAIEPAAARTVLDTLDRDSNDEQEREIRLMAALTILNSDPGLVRESIDAATVTPLLDGHTDEQKQACRVLGTIGGPESVKKLCEKLENDEDDETVDQARVELERITERTIGKLDEMEISGEGLETIRAIANQRPSLLAPYVQTIYHTLQNGRVEKGCETLGKALITIEETVKHGSGPDVWQLLDQMDELELGHRLTGRLIGKTALTESTETDTVVERLLDQLGSESASNRARSRLVALSECAREAGDLFSPPFRNQVVSLSRGAEADLDAEYAELIGALAVSDPAGEQLVPELVRYLDSESPRARRNAIEALVMVPPYPVPERVNASVNDPDTEVRELANSVSQAAEPPDPLPITTDGDAQSKLMSMNAVPKYQSQPGRWEPLTFDAFHEEILTGVGAAWENGTGGHVALPYYSPEASLLVPLELALQAGSRHEKATVALYSSKGHSHWGTWGDVRATLNQYGLDTKATPTSVSLPVTEWLDTGHVYNGELHYGDQHNPGPAELVLVRSPEDLDQLGRVDAVVCHLQGRCPMTAHDIITEIEHNETDTPVFVQYSLYTEHTHSASWPRYGFSETIDGALSALVPRFPQRALRNPAEQPRESDLQCGETPLSIASRQTQRLDQRRDLTVRRLGTRRLVDAFNGVYAELQDHDRSEVPELVSTTRSLLYQFLRLPVPIDVYNDWVRQESQYHGRYSPDTTQEMLQRLENVVDGSEIAYVPGAVQEIRDHADVLIEELADSNPKFDRIIECINKAASTDQRLAIAILSEQSRNVLRFAVERRTDIDPAALESDGIHICGLRELRTFEELDRVVFLEDPPREFANFYFLPAAEEIELLAYMEGLEERLDSWLEEQAYQMRDRLNATGDDWPAVPRVQTISELPEQASEEEATGTEIPDPGQFQDVTNREGWATIDRANDGPRTGGGRSEQPIWTVNISTEGGNTHRLDSNRSVLLKRSEGQSGESDYSWIRAGQLQTEDMFIIVPREVRQQLYRERLEEFYEGDTGERGSLDQLQLWWQSMREIASAHEDPGVVHSLLERDGLSKSVGAVRDWIRSVQAADQPVDLVEYPDLTIGPNRAEDIHIIGDTFDYDELVQEASLMQSTMNRFRQENREMGRELNEELIEMIRDPPEELREVLFSGTVASISHDGR